MLTLKYRIKPRAHLAATLFASFTLLAICGPAHAEGNGTEIGGCVGSWDTFNCVWRWGANSDPYVRQVPQPASDAEKGISTERERRWEQRCHPQIALDRFGVPRYLYSAPGCEYGAY